MAGTVLAVLAAARLAAAADLDPCDRLAANPPDPDRVALGVERKDVDLPAAIAACKAAVAAHPDVPRFSYQLGRVLFYDNQTAAALQSFQRAADGGYRQARFMIGLLMTRKYAGVPQDDCKVAQLWAAAARQDHVNAAVSFVRDSLRGRFAACPPQADRAEMMAFLKAAAGKADYLGNFLVEDLTRELAAKKGG
jgi:TPR repeat protein